MNKDEIIVMMIALMIVAVAFGSIISYNAGIDHQKKQPVNITISWYNATENTASFDEYALTDKGQIGIHPEPNITEYNIQKSHVNDP